MSKTLWMMCGCPGSGKTWFAKHKLMNGTGWRYISRDEIRFSIIKNEEDYFSHEKEVYAEFLKQINSALEGEGIFNVVADATHLDGRSRLKLINYLNDVRHGLKDINIIPVVVQTELEEAFRNNDQREGRSVVPHSVIRRMNMQFVDPKEDDFKYTAIMYVDNSRHHYIEKP